MKLDSTTAKVGRSDFPFTEWSTAHDAGAGPPGLLPLAPRSLQAIQPGDGGSVVTGPVGVLLVGDQPDSAMRAWRLLNCRVEAAEPRPRWITDLHAAPAFLAKVRVQAILFDLPPTNDGLAALELLRQEHGEIPLVALIDDHSADLQRHLLTIGVKDHLTRCELSADSLHRCLNHASERRRLREQLEAAERREQLRDAIIARIADNAPLQDVLAELGVALRREANCADCGFAISLDHQEGNTLAWPTDSASARLASNVLIAARRQSDGPSLVTDCRACLQSIRSGGRLLGELAMVPGKSTAAADTVRAYAVLAAELAALAVDRLQAADSLRHAREELGRLSAQLMIVQEAERQRIAGDLHDVIGQSLSVVKVSIEEAEQRLQHSGATEAAAVLGRLVPWVKVALTEVRRISMDLRPATIDDLGLLPTLSWFFQEFSASCRSTLIGQRIAVTEHDVPESLKIVIFRIVQEAFSNIVKHAKATRAEVALERAGTRIHLTVADDGCGFDAGQRHHACAHARGLGLSSMRERARASGGDFDIESTVGAGTRIVASWPLGS
jgi:signal transduction histidine kinase